VGVDLFFVLSGFLVSGLLFREQEKFAKLDLKRFLIRRGFKIYPPFWLMIVFTCLFNWWNQQTLPVSAVFSEFLFVQNYLPGLWNHTWSLAVEEHFYLLLALGALVLTKRSTASPFKAVPLAFIFVAVACLFGRIVLMAQAPFVDRTHLFPSHLRMDSLCFGVLISYYFHSSPERFLTLARRYRFPLFLLGGVMLLPAFLFRLDWHSSLYVFGLTGFYLAGGCLVVGALGLPEPKGKFSGTIAYIGSHSYSIYLWHMPVMVCGVALLPDYVGWGSRTVIYLAGSIAFGIAMALLIEFPLLRLRDRIFPSRGNPLHTGGGVSVS